jgi:hypothetical protein
MCGDHQVPDELDLFAKFQLPLRPRDRLSYSSIGFLKNTALEPVGLTLQYP